MNLSNTEAIADEQQEEEGCWAWAPAIIAIATLLLIIFFIFCAGSTYYLFQQRGDMALRTLDGTLVPLLEQSNMRPDDKTRVIQSIQQFVEEAKTQQFENWQVAGATQRLIRIPLLSWGDLQAIEDMIRVRESFSDQEKSDGLKAISRLMRAIELDEVTNVEMPQLFAPVSTESDNAKGYELQFDPKDSDLKAFLEIAGKRADDADVPDRSFEVNVVVITRRQIEAGIEAGMK